MSVPIYLCFTVPGEPPRTAQSRLRVFKSKSGRVFLGKTRDKKTEAFLGKILLAARQSLREAPRRALGSLPGRDPVRDIPREGKPASPSLREPLSVSLEFSFPYPASTPKSRSGSPRWRVERPDLDNLAKSVLDSLTRAGIFDDDSRVAELTLRKLNSPNPGLRVTVESLFPY
jgi:hypothetical protein